MPAKLPVREKICELMPITSPRRFMSGPPELPGFTATSVWMNGTASMFGSERFSRLVALMMPAVTVLAKPNGEPIATTHSPTRSLARMLPIFTIGRPVASTLITATSLRLSAPITLALSSRLSVKRTVISSAFSTTWALVTM